MVQEVRPDLFLIEVPLPDSPLKYLNSYVVRSRQRSLIIDTGLNRKKCLSALSEGLSEIGVDLNRTDFFITHLHADHFGLVSKLATPTSQVFFNRPEAEFIEAKGWWEPMLAAAAKNGFPDEELRKALEQHPGYKHSSEWVPDMRLLKDGDPIDVGDYHFTCLHTPGHSMGHTCLYEADKKLLVAGDHILIDITPNIQCWYEKANPLGDYIDSLDRVFKLEVDLVLPGHRRLIDNHRARIDELKRHHQDRCVEIVDILDQETLDAYQVASRMTWDIKAESWEAFPIAQKWFATGEAIAHLHYLEEKGRIQRLSDGDRIRYTAVNT